METSEAMLKRLAMRSWRRGTKEMDLILGPYGDAHLGTMDGETLTLYDALLEENDQDLLPWVLGQTPCPARFSALIADIATHARARLARN